MLGDGKTSERHEGSLSVTRRAARGRGFSLVLNDLEGRMETNRQELQAERFPLNTSENVGLLVWGGEICLSPQGVPGPRGRSGPQAT